jgi:uncharacterized protein
MVYETHYSLQGGAIMQRNEVILAAIAAGGHDARFGPAQIQKLFFLIDREIAERVSGPHFDFQPYDYGPFDKEVYQALDLLKEDEKVEVHHSGRYRRYAVTASGYEEGIRVLDTLDATAAGYMRTVATWVQSVSFQQLVSSIYKQYPEMKANSIFR